MLDGVVRAYMHAYIHTCIFCCVFFSASALAASSASACFSATALARSRSSTARRSGRLASARDRSLQPGSESRQNNAWQEVCSQFLTASRTAGSSTEWHELVFLVVANVAAIAERKSIVFSQSKLQKQNLLSMILYSSTALRWSNVRGGLPPRERRQQQQVGKYLRNLPQYFLSLFPLPVSSLRRILAVVPHHQDKNRCPPVSRKQVGHKAYNVVARLPDAGKSPAAAEFRIPRRFHLGIGCGGYRPPPDD